MFRRIPDRLRPALEGFRRVVEHVELAKASLTEAVPTTRLPGRPLAEAILEFGDELRAAEGEMSSWRAVELTEVWSACSTALAEARSNAERMRLEGAAPVGFEALIGAIGDLLAPLDAFSGAADRFRDLRTRLR